MKYLKKFEELDFSKSSLMTTLDFLNVYYNCENCNEYFKSTKELNKCPVCNCPNPTLVPEQQYYDHKKSKLSVDEYDELEKERIESQNTLIDMPSFFERDKHKKYYN